MPPALNRRKFLAWSGAAAVAAAGAGYGLDALLRRAGTDPLPPGAGVLVVLTMYGGNDGLNTVIPAGDGAYQSARPDLAYAEDEVLPLAEGLGLNPGMPGMKALWDDHRLAIVRGVSYPKPDRSHFRSMDIWQSASPDQPDSTGWLGRWLDHNGGDPLHAVSLDPVLPPMLAGATTAGAALPAAGVALPSGALGTAFRAMGHPAPGEPVHQSTAARAIADLHRAATTLGPALGDAPPAKGKGKRAAGQLAEELDLVAACIDLGAPSRVYSVSIGGFDTHTAERATQQRLLAEVDGAVSGFLGRMADSDRGRNVVLVAYSEFGRRVAANANQGTDHGTAGPVFVAGPSVRGGFQGAQPSLTDLTNGDLKPTTDFRDVYATLLAGVLGADPEPVLGPGRTTLPLLNS
ncbi:DUF1501 domain-containing protein [Pseudonocardia eucalypti]|uniref:DUF1501 domain-containing protein n=1 Tax=Pseudonocardia eucalypti TaxID=648755 RepID=A0ABP9QKW2_9PSEU|nr:uncharacterized protein (DUF1501 family) [Pseudonocardia eucalypti]